MKREVIELRSKLDLFLINSNLSEDQKKELLSIVEQIGKFKPNALILEEKTFREYVTQFVNFKFLFSKIKDAELVKKVEDFTYNFFFLTFPDVNRELIKVEIIVHGPGNIEVVELTGLTKTLFSTIVSTNILK